MKTLFFSVVFCSLLISISVGATPTIGRIKQGAQTADHNGWILLNGRTKASLTATQQAAATSIGIGTNLPNATDKVVKQKTGAFLVAGGSNTTTIARVNLPNTPSSVTLNTTGAHTHGFTGWIDQAGDGSYYSWLVHQTYNANPVTISPTATTGVQSNGDHNHTLTVPSGGSGTALTVENTYLSVNIFIYLGT